MVQLMMNNQKQVLMLMYNKNDGHHRHHHHRRIHLDQNQQSIMNDRIHFVPDRNY
jgi:hypothetical protein